MNLRETQVKLLLLATFQARSNGFAPMFLLASWVHEDFRRQGLGGKLLAMMESTVRTVGIEHMYTWTSGFQNPAFYESQGYHAFAVFEDFFEVKGYHHIGYRKDFL